MKLPPLYGKLQKAFGTPLELHVIHLWLCTHESNTLFLPDSLVSFHNICSQHGTWKKCMKLPLKTLPKCGYRFCGMRAEYNSCSLGLSCHYTAMSTLALLLATAGVTSLLQHSIEPFFEFSLPVCFTSVCCLAVLNFGNLLGHEHPSFQGCYTVLAGKHLLTLQMTLPPSKYQ
jgi:hypothetical protein